MALVAKGATAGDLMIVNAHAPASLTPLVRSGAIYLSVMNHGAEADKLVNLSTPAASTAELHETSNVDGVMKMRAIAALDIPAGATIDLKPAALHIMLTGLKAPLKEGDVVALTLGFEKAGDVTVEVKVGKAGMLHQHDAEPIIPP